MSPNATPVNPQNVAAKNFASAMSTLEWHPIFRPLLKNASVFREYNSKCPPGGWALVTSRGTIHAHPTRRGEAGEWVYVLAHCLLHLGFGHFEGGLKAKTQEWNATCDIYIAQFLQELKLGYPPRELELPEELLLGRAASEERLYDRFCEEGIPEKLLPC